MKSKYDGMDKRMTTHDHYCALNHSAYVHNKCEKLTAQIGQMDGQREDINAGKCRIKIAHWSLMPLYIRR